MVTHFESVLLREGDDPDKLTAKFDTYMQFLNDSQGAANVADFSLISGKVKSLQDEVDQLNKNIEHYIDVSATAHNDKDSSKAQLKTEQGKVLALESEVTRIIAELGDTQGELSNEQNKVTRYEADVENKTKELKKNRDDMILKDAELANDKLKKQGCTTKLQDEENKYKETMKQLTAMDTKYAELDEAHRELQRQNRPVRTQTAQLKDRVSILLDRLQELVPTLHGQDYLRRFTEITDLIKTVFDDVTEDASKKQLLKAITDSLWPRGNGQFKRDLDQLLSFTGNSV
jgi:chromosome segregation ATPase